MSNFASSLRALSAIAVVPQRPPASNSHCSQATLDDLKRVTKVRRANKVCWRHVYQSNREALRHAWATILVGDFSTTERINGHERLVWWTDSQPFIVLRCWHLACPRASRRIRTGQSLVLKPALDPPAYSRPLQVSSTWISKDKVRVFPSSQRLSFWKGFFHSLWSTLDPEAYRHLSAKKQRRIRDQTWEPEMEVSSRRKIATPTGLYS